MAPFVSASGQTNTSGEVWTDGPGNATDWNRHGLTLEEIHLLWSADNESNVPLSFFNNSSDIDSYLGSINANETYNTTVYSSRQYGAGSDVEFTSPPGDLVERWNTNDSGSYSLAGSDQTSLVPQGVSTKDGSYIKDAFVTEYTISPMTIVHVDGSTEQRMISRRGTATLLTDYWIDVPDPSGRTWGGGRHTWKLVDHEVNYTRISDGTCGIHDSSCEIAGGSGGNIDDIDFSGINQLTNEFVYEAEIEVELERKTRRRYRHSHCGNCSSHSHTRTTYRTYTETLEVSERVPVEYNALTSAQASFAEYPDGDYVLYVTAQNQLWQGAKTRTTELGITSGLSYYTQRDTDWDVLEQYSESGSVSTGSELHPVEVHAYPSARGPERFAINEDVGEIVGFTESSITPVSINPHVDVRLDNSGDVSLGRDVVYKFNPWENMPSHQMLQFYNNNGELINVYGVVAGNMQTLSGYNAIQVNESNLTAEVVGPPDSNGAVPVKYTLVDGSTGDPIDLSTTVSSGGGGSWAYFSGGSAGSGNGYIRTTDGQDVYTNTTGEVTVNVTSREGYVGGEYVPRPWWEIKNDVYGGAIQPYAGDTTNVYQSTGWPSLMDSILPLMLVTGVIFFLTKILATAIGWQFNLTKLLREFFGLD